MPPGRGAACTCPVPPLNRPFMIGICQGQTELSSPHPPDGGLLASSRALTGRALYASYRAVFVFVQFVYSAPSFCVLFRSTAKRDQSFISTYPASSEAFT